jgi:hypothetical protein
MPFEEDSFDNNYLKVFAYNILYHFGVLTKGS